MKKLSLLLVALFSFVLTKAYGPQFGNSSLNVKLWNNSGFDIIVNNQFYPRTSNFNMRALSPGIHTIKIVKQKRNRYGNGGMSKVLYDGTVMVPKNSKVYATVTPNRNINVKVIKRKHNRNYTHNHYNNQCSSFQPTRNWGGEYCGVNTPSIMNSYEFDRLMNTVANTTFDDDKLMVAQQALKHNVVSAEQVLLLMNQLTFDANKLELAKMAFHQTVDKHNYYVVNNGFAFSSSANKLNDYVIRYS